MSEFDISNPNVGYPGIPEPRGLLHDIGNRISTVTKRLRRKRKEFTRQIIRAFGKDAESTIYSGVWSPELPSERHSANESLLREILRRTSETEQHERAAQNELITRILSNLRLGRLFERPPSTSPAPLASPSVSDEISHFLRDVSLSGIETMRRLPSVELSAGIRIRGKCVVVDSLSRIPTGPGSEETVLSGKSHDSVAASWSCMDFPLHPTGVCGVVSTVSAFREEHSSCEEGSGVSNEERHNGCVHNSSLPSRIPRKPLLRVPRLGESAESPGFDIFPSY